MHKGMHVTLDAIVSRTRWDSRFKSILDFAGPFRDCLEACAYVGNATVLRSEVIKLPHPEKSRPESPPGGTAWVGLDESHITIHWYEYDDRVEFAMDVFTCGRYANPNAILDHFETYLSPDQSEFIKYTRNQVARL